jgi:hypothetical protein
MEWAACFRLRPRWYCRTRNDGNRDKGARTSTSPTATARDVHYQKYCGTPPEHLLFGLRQALDMLFAEWRALRHGDGGAVE